MPTPRLWLTSGEPAGIGPELALALAEVPLDAELVVLGDPLLLHARAKAIGNDVRLDDWMPGMAAPWQRGRLWVYAHRLAVEARPGQLDPRNAGYVLGMLDAAVDACRSNHADAMVTAPVHKGVIADAGRDDPALRVDGRPFSGHTEFIASRCGGTPVMMLVADDLRVALATTHLSLREVPAAITRSSLERTLAILGRDLRQRFGISAPRIRVCGLNPHAGEGGHLGREEIDIITPAIAAARANGLDVDGPYPADTLLTPSRWRACDAVLAMYHDQGLPPLKFAGFGQAVNVTLGLPLVRTSVDHGTALDLAGTGRASAGSLIAAVSLATDLARGGSTGR